jgi:hypothetical protein
MLARLSDRELRNAEAAPDGASPRSTRCVAKRGIVAIPLFRLCSMVAMLVIAGCAGPMGTIHTDTTATPVVTAFDGIRGTISGQVRDTHMEGSIDGSACVYAFTGERM